MVAAVPVKPIVLANFFLDTGTAHYSGRTMTFKGVNYVKGIITAGSVERSIPLPSGLLQVPDASITVADTNGQIKTWFDTTTPFRRLVDITPELESHFLDVTTNKPLFIGEILDFDCPPGEVTVHLRSVTASWLARPILHLINRDTFPNLPDDISTAFAPIIFGRCFSYSTTNVEAQGAIQCTLVDTNTNDYCVARHPCFSVPAVYRKRPLDSRFTLVPGAEYSLQIVNKTIGGITYNMQMIRFAAQQYDGTIIQCDVSGTYSRYNWSTNAQIDSVEIRNPSDCLWNLIYLQLKNETNIQKFDSDSFATVRDRCTTRGYFCDGAITGKTNSLTVITAGAAIADLCGCFNIDFTQTTASTIKILLFDLTIDAPLAIPINSSLILEKTFHPSSPENVYNHIRYRYYRDNAGLPDGVRAKGNKEYAYEYSIRNVHDQTELAATGANPTLELVIDQPFIRDDATAIDVIKKKIPYFALRSYDVTFSLPAWTGGLFAGFNVDLGQACNLTSIWGMGSGGFNNILSRIKRIRIDLKTWDIDCSATVYWPTSDGDLSIEFTSHPSHTAQTRNPHFPTTVNGATPVTAPKSVNFSSAPTPPAGRSNVVWVEDATTEPRTVSAHYAATGGADDDSIYELIVTHDADVALITSHIHFTATMGGTGGVPSGTQWVDTYINDIYPRIFTNGIIPFGNGSGGASSITNGDLDNWIPAIINAITWLGSADDDSAYATITYVDSEDAVLQGQINTIVSHTFFSGNWVDAYINDIYARITTSGTIQFGDGSGGSTAISGGDQDDWIPAIINSVDWISGVLTAHTGDIASNSSDISALYTAINNLQSCLSGYGIVC
jgi:hypothetical protein